MSDVATECVFCGRSGGAIAEGGDTCHKCLAEQDPTPLQEWAQTQRRKLRELVEETGLTEKTIDRAARGQRMSAAAARAISDATDIPAEAFLDEARHQERA